MWDRDKSIVPFQISAMNCNTFEITFITVTGSFEDVNTTNTNNPVKAAEALMCVQCKKVLT